MKPRSGPRTFRRGPRGYFVSVDALLAQVAAAMSNRSRAAKPYRSTVAGAFRHVPRNVQEVASATLRCLRRHVPAAVPGIVFLSGGQTDRMATAHLNEISSAGAQALEDQLFVWPCPPGCGDGGLARAGRESDRRPACLLPQGPLQQRSHTRGVHRSDGGGMTGAGSEWPDD
jgi:Fructose-bisphosphate aldolase class-I